MGLNGGDPAEHMVTSGEGRALLLQVTRIANAQLETAQQLGELLREVAHMKTETRAALGRIHERVIDIDERLSQHREKLESIPGDVEITANRVIELHDAKALQKRADNQNALVRTIVGGVAIAIIVGVLAFVAGHLVH